VGPVDARIYLASQNPNKKFSSIIMLIFPKKCEIDSL